jgi:hypothetical protein
MPEVPDTPEPDGLPEQAYLDSLLKPEAAGLPKIVIHGREIAFGPSYCKLRDGLDERIIRCKEAPEKYAQCPNANRIFKSHQCCKPDAFDSE